jgi:hypothetical protein
MKPVPELLSFVVLHNPGLGATVVHVPVDSAYPFSEISIEDGRVFLGSVSGERHELADVGPEVVAMIEGDHPIFVEHSDADGEGFAETWYRIERTVPAPVFGG